MLSDGAQAPAGAAEGTPVTVAGVSAIAVKLREKPSRSAALIEYWSTTTQKEPELFMPVGVTVLVVARTAEKDNVEQPAFAALGRRAAL